MMNILTQNKEALINGTHVRYFAIHKDAVIAQMGDDDTVQVYTDASEENVTNVYHLLIAEIKKHDDRIEIDELHRRATGDNKAPGVIIG